jgi:hypothetical protein
MACSALEALRVVTALIGTDTITLHCLKVLAFDAAVAGRTQGPVTLVVVLSTKRAVVQDVEIGRWEGSVAFKANETSMVVSSSEATIRGGDGLTGDCLATTLTVTLGTNCGERWRNWSPYRLMRGPPR